MAKPLALQIDNYLRRRGSPMAGLGRRFVTAGNKYGVDPRLLVGIGVIESGAGAHLAAPYNFANWGIHAGTGYKNFGHAIEALARGLQHGYISQGLKTPQQIVRRYAPSSDGNDEANWARVVQQTMGQIGSGTGWTQRSPTRTGLPGTAKLPGTAQQRHQFALQSLGAIARGDDPVEAFTRYMAEVKRLPTPVANGAAALPASGVPVVADEGKVVISPGADRPGVKTGAAVLAFARQVAARFGAPLTIGTGTNHSKMTVNGNVSDHWGGNAVDIPASGKTLTRMGRAALIAAGADPKWARKQTGGLFNIGGHQIIFNTTEGGNHWNHLHISV